MRPLSVKQSESVEAGEAGKTACEFSGTQDASRPHSQDGRVTLCAAGLEPLQGEAGDFARVFQVELVFDVCAVCLYGFGAEMQ